MNLLQAAAACHALGLAADQIRAGIGRAAPPPGRLEPVTRPGDPFAVLVDYAHTDDALHKVLATLRPLRPPGGALRVVFGCGGDRDRTKRPRMGAVAAGLADAVYVTSDNPRTERPDAIIAEIVAGIPAERLPRATVEPDRRAAIEAAIADAAPGDVVLIAGKGHEDYQIVPDGRGGTRTLAFDDREVARRALGTPGVTVRSAAGGVIA
jgi:UDP-N-acetylmuramoyl-L-alanyl-D-glutamate--2,6-diaminopimelate ligase